MNSVLVSVPRYNRIHLSRFVDGLVRLVPSVTEDLRALLGAPELLGGPLVRIIREFFGRTFSEDRIPI